MADPSTVPQQTFDDDAYDIEDGSRALDFLYDGRPLTADEFTAHVQSYNFGAQGLAPPDFVVLHHTASPCTVLTQADARAAGEAWIRNAWVWDADEGGKSEDQVKAQRQKGLERMRNFYRDDNGWDRGPHLYIDDRYIWLMTPLAYTGVHALGGNSVKLNGQSHRSIGIEVVGYYERKQWPPAVARLVGHAVAVLKQRLGTFELRYLYPNGGVESFQAPDKSVKYRHLERLAVGGIASHRDFNKPMCPGAAVTESFYLGVLQAGWDALHTPPVPVSGPAPGTPAPLLGPASGTQAQVAAYVRAQLPAGSEYQGDVDTILGFYWQYAPPVGLDPFLAAVQCALETDSLRSARAARPHRNPANLGVSDTASAEPGLDFASWGDGVQAHLAHLLALAVRDDAATPAQKALLARDPPSIAAGATERGTCVTTDQLAAGWHRPADYGANLLALAERIRHG